MNILVTCKADQFRVEENAKIRDELRNRRVVLGAKRDGSPLMKPIFEAWLEHPKRRTYPQGLKFMPGQPPELDGRFNTWRGWGITPVAGDWSTIEHHIRYVLCGGNNDVAEYVLNWMALRYQRPHSAMGVCLVFRSAPGVGKSTVGNWLRTISGSAMMTVTQPDQLAGRFTPHLRDVHLIIAEEAIFSGNHAIRGPLKSLITDTTLTVEGKFLPVQEVANNVGLIMFSNEAWVAPVEMGDRRFMVVECAPKQEPGYYTELYDRAPVELPAFFDALLKRDLTKFSIWNFPKTEARSEQIAQTLSGADRIVYELLRDETLPDPHYRLNGEKRWDSAGWWGEPFHVPKSSMRKHANDHSGKHLRGRSITDKELKSALERAGVQGKRISLPDGTRPWCWEFPKLGEARKEFGRRLGFPLQWGDEP